MGIGPERQVKYSARMTRFHKMHGLGNDFVILDSREAPVDLAPFYALADRRTGIGYDQLIVLDASNTADCTMDIYNADGSRAGMCGNAARCVAWLEAKRSDKTGIAIDVYGRIVRADRIGHDSVRVDMGVPALSGSASLHPDLPHAALIDMGNPHAVFFGHMQDFDTVHLGSIIEHHAHFPDRTNVEFCEVKNPHLIDVIVWERGAGFTQACGSGACAVGVAAIKNNLAQTPVTTRFPGGDLVIEWDGNDSGPVYMTGPIAYVFEGSI